MTESMRFAGKARKAARFLALAFVACLPLMAEVALAQDLVPPADVGGGNGYRLLKPRRGGFFEMLFGPSLLEPFRPPPPPQQTYAPPPPSQPSEPPVPTVQILPKDKDARKILVVGDFVADGVAWGLDQTFAGQPHQGLTDRGARHAEAFGQLHLINRRAGGQGEIKDLIAQKIIDQLDPRAAFALGKGVTGGVTHFYSPTIPCRH